MRRLLLLVLFSSVLIWLSAIPASAGMAGRPDPTFGTGGSIRHNVSNFGGGASAAAVQADGKIVLAGSIGVRFGVFRLNADGTLDTSFGTNGVSQITNFFETDNNSSQASDVIIQPDGKIIVVGSAVRANFIPQNGPTYSYSGVTIVRYNQDGSLDTSFDGDGIVTTVTGGSSNGYGVELQADGKILVAEGNNFAIIRYNTNGSLDTTFGIGGIAKTNFGSDNARASDLKVLPDGKIVIAGQYNPVGQIFVAIARYNTNGTLDTTFDGDGKITTSVNEQFTYGLEIQPDGKMIILLGSGLARFLPNGSLDTTFGSGGTVTLNPANFIAREVTLQPDGKIIAGGTANWVFSPTNGDFGIARFLPNGSPDTSFDGDGVAVIDMSPEESANAVVIQPDGKIIAAGISKESALPTHVTAVRVQARAHAFADFDGDAKTDVSIFRPSNGQWWISKSGGGISALEFGVSSDKLVPADYTGDGKTDIAVYRPASGEWFVLRSENNSFYGFQFGSAGDIPQAADFDGDGKADYGVFRPTTNTWFIQKASGGVIIQQFGSANDIPAAADYDGDGKADIAIYRPASGEWWVSKSGGEIFSIQFGSSADKPVQADYTGDGKTDIAVFRPSTGEWFVLRSENLSSYSTVFGTPEDLPVPGDYDGDGKSDIAVYRPSNRVWYVNRSTAGMLFQQFGTNGDKPVPSAFGP